MNAAGSALAWCALQIAVVGAATALAYWLVVRLHQAAGGFAATTGLAVVFCLSAAAASPWPRWSFLEARPTEANDDAKARGSKVPLLGALTRLFPGLPPPRESGMGERRPRLAAAGSPSPMRSPAPERAELPQFSRTLLQGMHGTFWLDRGGRARRWPWTASLAAMFAVGLAWGGVRLLAALGAVVRVRRRSLPIHHPRLLQILTALQTTCGSTRRVELRESAGLSAPATLGWRRPVILLPADWRAWSEGECRAVLAHELAHVERGDYLMWLAAQLALVLHFYHPAVHWLARRIRLEQEFAADAIAASLVGGRRPYLTLLARMALRASAPASPFSPPSFLSTRKMLFQRIDRLRSLEKEGSAAGRWMSKIVATAILATAGIVACGLRGESVWMPASPPAAQAFGLLPGQAASQGRAVPATARLLFLPTRQENRVLGNDAEARPGPRVRG